MQCSRGQHTRYIECYFKKSAFQMQTIHKPAVSNLQGKVSKMDNAAGCLPLSEFTLACHLFNHIFLQIIRARFKSTWLLFLGSSQWNIFLARKLEKNNTSLSSRRVRVCVGWRGDGRGGGGMLSQELLVCGIISQY